MLVREIIAVYSKNRRNMYLHYGENAEFLNVKTCDRHCCALNEKNAATTFPIQAKNAK
jgi:hypothetical protein